MRFPTRIVPRPAARALALLLALAAPLPWPAIAPAGAQTPGATETVRPEIGKPLIAAQELMKTQRYREALARIREADAVPNKTPHEAYLVDRLRGTAAAHAGDNETAARSLEAALASGRVAPAERPGMTEALIGIHYRAKDYAKTVALAQRYLQDGGKDPGVRSLYPQALFLGNDYAGAANALLAEFQAADAAGRAPAEERIQLLLSAYLKLNDRAGMVAALERLVTHYPKKEYWANLIQRLQARPGFSERFTLDVLRLRLETGNLTSAEQYMEAAQLALQAGYPAEAQKFLDKGYAAGALGKGAEAERQRRLRDMAARQAADDRKTLAKGAAEAGAAKTGQALVNTGWAYVGYGEYDKGLALMEEGLRRGGLKRAEDARLLLGIAYLQAGKSARAIEVLGSVRGTGGLEDLARLWTLQARRR